MAYMVTTCKKLLKDFNESTDYNGISDFQPLSMSAPSFTYMTRMDGKRFRLLGTIYPFLYNMRDKYKFDRSLFKYIPEFWNWLELQPSAKYIGKASDWAESSEYRDAILYKNIIFIYSGEEYSIIEFGSRNRFKNSTLWKIEKLNTL